MIQCSTDQVAKIGSATISSANLCCTFCQPPPKYIAAALSANVSYQSEKFMRFRATAGKDYYAPQELATFTLAAVNFSYMPSIFMIEVGPDYNEKLNFIAKRTADAEESRLMEASKEDRRMGIVGLRLIVNTSPNVVPDKGSASVAADGGGIINLRYNSRQLYDMYLKNSASVERAIYDFDEWYQRGCCVLISSADMNGILPSCHIRGNVSIQGTITAVNTLGYKVYCGITTGGTAIAAQAGDPGRTEQHYDGGADGPMWWIRGQKFEKYQCSITGVYSNSYMALDAKSGIVGESVMSEQFGNSMRLSTAQ